MTKVLNGGLEVTVDKAIKSTMCFVFLNLQNFNEISYLDIILMKI